MKHMKFLASLLALATVWGSVSALAESPAFSLGVGAQYWFAKDADEIDEDGLSGGAVIARIRPSDYLAFDFRAGGVGIWKSDKWRYEGQKYESDTTFYCIPLEVGLLLMLPLDDTFTLYAGPGVGYYYYDVDIEVRTREGRHTHKTYSERHDLEDDFGWYAVAGLNISLAPNISIFGEARYTDTETSVKHESDSKFDASGVGVMAGLMFDF